jgi:circadian clock protein KaiC
MAKAKLIEKLEPELHNHLNKVRTGIPGFDEISYGGLPKGRSTLISGSSGSGKTIFGCQFLTEGILRFEEPGVFVTFEENVTDIIDNVKSFGWNIKDFEDKKLWRFVDASVPLEHSTKIIGDYDLDAFLIRVENAINEVKAKRIVLDSIGLLFDQFQNPPLIRHALMKVISFLKKKDIVTVITCERLEEYGLVSRFGVEEYIADNVMILRNVLENEKRRRTIEILKYRGSVHSAGEQSFVIDQKGGIFIIPLTRLQLTQQSHVTRVATGNKKLDEMCGGGFFKDSIILISGATGTGKTLMVTEFIKGSIVSARKVLFLAFEESREQLTRNAAGWGIDFAAMEKAGQLQMHALYPETASLEEHLINIERLVLAYGPDSFVLDSLSALERGSSKKNFREFLITLISFLKKHEITSIFTSTSSNIVGGTSVTENHISTITDSIILLRYAEVYGEIHRVITILKMRGSMHTKGIFEFTINGNGMVINDDKFRMATGILGGLPVPAEHDRR